jgi:hypothetical protein
VQSSLVLSISTTPKTDESGEESYRITFALDSALNTNGAIAPSECETATRKELYALGKALDIVQAKFGDGKTSKVVIITSAGEVVEGLSKGVWEWEYSGYENVTDGDSYKAMHKRIGALEGKGVDVSFWLVDEKDAGVLGIDPIHRPVVWKS